MENSVKAFVVGDPHFKRNNIIDGRSFVNKCIPAAEKFNPDFIVILGDTLHNHDIAYNSSFELAYEFIEGLQRVAHVFIIIGNHDLLSHTQFLTSKHFFLPYRRWDNVTVVDFPICREIKSFTFTFCPYVPSGRFLEALDTLIKKGQTWDLSDCIFAHQEFRGCSMENGKVSDKGDRWDENYPPVITGHIHKSQTIKNVHYPGSAYQHTFAEDPDKKVWGVTFLENSESGFKIKKIDLKIPGKRRVFLDVSDVDHFDESLIDKHQIQLSLKGSPEEFKVFDKSKKAKVLKGKGVKICKEIITEGVIEKRSSSHVFLDVFQELLLQKNTRIQEACKLIYPEILKESKDTKIVFHESMESDDSQGSIEICGSSEDSKSDCSNAFAENSDSDDFSSCSGEDCSEYETKTLQTTDTEILNTSDIFDSTEIANTSDIFDSDDDTSDISEFDEEEETEQFEDSEEYEEEETEHFEDSDEEETEHSEDSDEEETEHSEDSEDLEQDSDDYEDDESDDYASD